jgi:predicted SprT family Zn-dependent metalloprotease
MQQNVRIYLRRTYFHHKIEHRQFRAEAGVAYFTVFVFFDLPNEEMKEEWE